MVTKITDLSDVPIVEYVYDDGGFRYKKKNYTGGVLTKTTLYIRDISGHIASIYEKTTGTYSLEEVPFYGSSRLGSIQDGNKYIDELKDHLGNVRQTIRTTNGVPPVDTASTKWAYTKANYYPFGLKFDDINGSSADYRYGYQGEYAEDEGTEAGIQTNSFQLRLYNPRLGRWLSPDPYKQYHSPYLAMGNNPISSVDPDGGKADDWFKYQAKGETEANWHKGKTATYIDDKGVSHTLTNGFRFLSVFRKTGVNSEGAETGQLALYDQDKIVTFTDKAFSGGVGGLSGVENGDYFMRLDIRNVTDPVEVVDNGADDMQPKITWGLEIFPKNGKMIWQGKSSGANTPITNAYGNSRIRLIPAKSLGNNNADRGLYLHGEKSPHSSTHGCLCDKQELIQNFFISGAGKGFKGKVPLNVF